MNENSVNTDKPAPRFVFRTFGRDFGDLQEQMAALTIPVPDDLRERIYNETYLISPKIDTHFIKLKAKSIIVKKLIFSEGNIEQWDIVKKLLLPLTKNDLEKEVFPVLDVAIPVLAEKEITRPHLLDIVKRHKELEIATVHKKQLTFIINYSICEFSEVIIGNEYLYSVGVESTEREDMQKTIRQLKLEKIENINYIEAIKRVLEIHDKSFAN